MPPERDEWRGAVRSRGDVQPVVLTNYDPNGMQYTGSSGTFRAFAGSERWWVKPLVNPQSQRVPANELLVGMAAALIGAPACVVSPVRIPQGLEGYEYRPGFKTVAGVTASGSRHVDGSAEERALNHRPEDDNRVRHAGVYALYDWCWGGDDQWLYCADQANRLFSHDHGHYFPSGPDWTEQSLSGHVDTSHQLQAPPPDDLDPAALDELSSALEGLDRTKIEPILQVIPPDWPVTDQELETVGWFLHRRAAAVAGRLRQMKGAST